MTETPPTTKLEGPDGLPDTGVPGAIVAIMEVFPLRLSVKTRDATVGVQLTERTRILRKRKAIGMGELRNGDRVRIIGTKRGKTARFHASEIVLTFKN